VYAGEYELNVLLFPQGESWFLEAESKEARECFLEDMVFIIEASGDRVVDDFNGDSSPLAVANSSRALKDGIDLPAGLPTNPEQLMFLMSSEDTNLLSLSNTQALATVAKGLNFYAFMSSLARSIKLWYKRGSGMHAGSLCWEFLDVEKGHSRRQSSLNLQDIRQIILGKSAAHFGESSSLPADSCVTIIGIFLVYLS